MKKIIFSVVLSALVIMLPSAVYGQWVSKALHYDGIDHQYEAEEINITVNGEKIEEYSMIPIIFNGRTLVPARDVFEKIGGEISWNTNDKIVTVKKGTNIIELKINDCNTKVNGEIKVIDFPPKIVNDYTLIPLRAVSESLDCETLWNGNERMVYINENEEEPEDSVIYKPERESTAVTAAETTTVQTTEKASETTTATQTTAATQTTTAIQTADTYGEGGITLLWDYIYAQGSNDTEKKRKTVKNLDVLSPTWFVISDKEGTVSCKASHDYESWAHENGYKIWALMTNSFDAGITHDVLNSYEKRQKVIAAICKYAAEYNVDGINIDFEGVGKTDGGIYLQFIKEITPALKEKGLVVSVDMYVPTVWTAHYQMEEVGKIVDYVCIMAYDEHYGGSEEAGSVSSMPWVDKYIKAACEKVESKKILMGMPFYTRKWGVDQNGKVVENPALTMEDAWAAAKAYGVTPVWDEECGQYYAKFYDNNLTYRIWLEDERSIEERLKIAKKYNLGGVAAWQRNYEFDSVWDVIGRYY